MTYILTITKDHNGEPEKPLSIPFTSDDSDLDIAARVIAALNQKRRGPRKAKAATGDGK